MRPLDHKLKYQIDKLVRTAVTGSLGKTDFLFVVMNASTSNQMFNLALAWKINSPADRSKGKITDLKRLKDF